MANQSKPQKPPPADELQQLPADPSASAAHRPVPAGIHWKCWRPNPFDGRPAPPRLSNPEGRYVTPNDGPPPRSPVQYTPGPGQLPTREEREAEFQRLSEVEERAYEMAREMAATYLRELATKRLEDSHTGEPDPILSRAIAELERPIN